MKILDNKIVRVISSIIEWIIIALLIVLIVLVACQKFSNNRNFFGYRIYTIVSGSMIPTYGVGDTLLIKEMSADNIKIGDAVTYLGDSGGLNGRIITHQVVDIEYDENGKVLFHTKGIANNIEDPIVSQDQVLGKVIHKFLFLSVLGKLTTSMPLLFTFIVVPIAIIIAFELAKLVYRKDEDEEEVEEEVKEEEEEVKEEEETKTEEKEIEEKVEDDNAEDEEFLDATIVLEEGILEEPIERIVEKQPEKPEPVVNNNNNNTNNKKKKNKNKYYNNKNRNENNKK